MMATLSNHAWTSSILIAFIILTVNDRCPSFSQWTFMILFISLSDILVLLLSVMTLVNPLIMFCSQHDFGFCRFYRIMRELKKIQNVTQALLRPLTFKSCMLPFSYLPCVLKSQPFRSLYSHALLILGLRNFLGSI